MSTNGEGETDRNQTEPSPSPAGEEETQQDLKVRLEKRLALLKQQIAQRKEAEEALRRESAIVKLLQEVTVAANEARSARSAFRFTLAKICAFTGWPLGHVYLLAAADEKMVSGRIWYCDDDDRFGGFREVTEATSFPAGTGWLGQVFAEGQPAWVTDIGKTPDFVRSRQLGDVPVTSGFAFPVRIGSDVVAVLEFFSPHVETPDADLLNVLGHIGTQLGRVVERERAEDALRHSEMMLAEAERLAHLGSWEWDLVHNQMTWSDEMYRIYGLEPAAFDATFAGFLKRVHPDDQGYVRRVVETSRVTKRSFTMTHRITRPGGEVRILHSRGKPVLDEAGKLIRMVGTGQDVTAFKEAEARLDLTAQQLVALNEMGRTVTASLDLDVVFERVLTELRPLLSAEGIFILLLEGEELAFAAVDHVDTGNLKGRRVPATSGIAGEVVHTGQAKWVYGEESRERAYRYIEDAIGYPVEALLAAPLRLRGEWIGVIEAIHSDPDAFDADDLRLLEGAATWTAVAIGNARLFQAQEQARQTAETLRDANVALSQTLDLDAVLETFLEYLERLVGYEQAAVLLPERGSRVRIRAVRGYTSHQALYQTIEVSSYPDLQTLLATQQSLLLVDVQDHTSWNALPGTRERPGSWLGVPLVANEELVGVSVLERERPGSFTEKDRLLAEALAGQATIALQNARLFTEVQSGRERLRYLSRKVVSAQEQERRRVSQELHDEAGQALTALKMSLGMIRDGLLPEFDDLRAQLGETMVLTEQTMEKIRRLAHDMRPPALDTLGLPAALEGLCRDFAERTPLTILYDGVDLPTLPDAATISYYRFLQEALTNAAKHADAEKVEVILEQQDETVMLSVADDGQGFTVQEELASAHTRSGMGLIGMQERFELLGGRLEIDSAPGRGTRVAAFIPLSLYQPNSGERGEKG